MKWLSSPWHIFFICNCPFQVSFKSNCQQSEPQLKDRLHFYPSSHIRGPSPESSGHCSSGRSKILQLDANWGAKMSVHEMELWGTATSHSEQPGKDYWLSNNQADNQYCISFQKPWSLSLPKITWRFLGPHFTLLLTVVTCLWTHGQNEKHHVGGVDSCYIYFFPDPTISSNHFNGGSHIIPFTSGSEYCMDSAI